LHFDSEGKPVGSDLRRAWRRASLQEVLQGGLLLGQQSRRILLAAPEDRFRSVFSASIPFHNIGVCVDGKLLSEGAGSNARATLAN
jgi:hypothetical protein